MATIPYKNKHGKRVQGATTVAGQNCGWGKEPLLIWANKQGQEGKSLSEARDTATISGTIAHTLIESDLKGIKADLTSYTPDDICKAETAYLNYLEWRKQFDFEPVYIEHNMVSEVYQYGGCPDIIGKVRGKWAIVDWKTGRIFESIFMQFAAYEMLARHNDLVSPIDQFEFHCLRIPKNEDTPSFHHSYWGSLPNDAWMAFQACLQLARAREVLRKLL